MDYLFVPEVALHLLCVLAGESALKGHRTKAKYCGSSAAQMPHAHC